TNLGFNTNFLNAGKLVYQAFAAPLAGPKANAFYNIRGATKSTVGGITWATLTAPYTIGTSPSPIVDNPVLVPGDGVQPAWTTKLLALPAGHCKTITSNIDHVFMMEYPATQN